MDLIESSVCERERKLSSNVRVLICLHFSRCVEKDDSALMRHVRAVCESLTAPWCIVPASNVSFNMGPPVVLSPSSHELPPLNPNMLPEESFEVDIARPSQRVVGKDRPVSPAGKKRLSRLFCENNTEGSGEDGVDEVRA